MIRLLLDAHALIWWDHGSTALGANTRKAIMNADHVFVSAVSEWELAIKAGLGKVALRRTVKDAALEAGFELLPVTFEHAQGVRTLKPIHKDPFDRLLVATTLAEGLTLVTADPVLFEYPIRVLDARK